MNRLLTCVAILLLAAPLSAQAEQELKSGDQKKLGKQIGEWVESTIEGDSAAASEALMDLDKVMTSVNKKLKGRSCLSLVADWSHVMSSGRKYATSGKNVDGNAIKKGSIQDVDLAGWGTASMRIPAKYEPKKVAYPLIILVCDTPAASIEALPAIVKDHAVVVAPHIENLTLEKLMAPDGQRLFLVPLGLASRDYRIDRSKVFLVAEGERAIDFSSRYAALLPHFYAGLATVAGSSGEFKGKANLELMQSGEHVDLAAASEWCMTAEARDPYPTTFEIELTEPWNGRAYWVQALKFDSPDAIPDDKLARMKVSVDRGTNTITIDGEFVYQVKLFLNDVIVDLDKPITVIRNGAEYTYQASRSIGTLLDNFSKTLDDTIYPSTIRSVDIPIVEGDGSGK
ncbi:MAG: hypothetical protein GY747_00600 [Planctomycetes bacterium]|nr:hypothetical protein [Planctomycetota bacterium]MCP4770809.1 hypothetical protein [Planctomycetota bacterium]